MVIPDRDRLYATVDEYFFKNPSPGDAFKTLNNSGLTAEALRETRFFLTSSSRAPEVTLFNTPRIGLWPITAIQPAGKTTARNAYDKAIAFCTSLGVDPATSGGFPYFFQRSQVSSINLTPTGGGSYSTPGGGAWVFGADYPASSTALAYRNNQIFSYLQNLTSKNIPGFGSNFLTKYPNDRDQILTESLDYIRSCVNTSPTPQKNLDPHYSYAPQFYVGTNQVVPLKIGANIGAGRYFTISEAALIFYPTEVKTDSSGNNPVTTKMGAVLLLQPYCISPGLPALAQLFNIKVTGLETLTTDVGSLGMPANSGKRIFYTEKYGVTKLGNKTAHSSIAGQFFNCGGGGYDLIVDPSPWKTNTPIPIDSGTFTLNAGSITISIYADNAYKSLVQKIKINFPTVTLPTPTRAAPVATTNFDQPIMSDSTSTSRTFTLDYDSRFYRTVINPVSGQKTRYSRTSDVATLLQAHLIQDGDTVFAMGLDTSSQTKGDMRLVAYNPDTPASFFTQQPAIPGSSRLFHNLRMGAFTTEGQFVLTGTSQTRTNLTGGKLVANLNYPNDAVPAVPPSLNGITGDFDTGIDFLEDGPFINKADEGSIGVTANAYFSRGASVGFGISEPAKISYSPNRQIASGVMLGSLPTGVYGKTLGTPEPWQTLLFNPHPAAGSAHYGFQLPKDHLWLDLFWMPIVDPYPISEPLSTAGKVNMNYQILPFTNIKRSTGLHSVLKSTKMMAIPDDDVGTYKSQSTTSASDYRLPINMDPTSGTLKGFEDRFNAGDIFRNASEICTVSLVPNGASYSSMSNWWSAYRLTGDNIREAPYNQLYPRLTTQSNTYTVHYRVQVLQQRPASDPSTWEEGKDVILAEQRGSTTLERYVDPADPDLPDFTAPAQIAGGSTLDGFYHFRTISNTKFAP